MHKRGNEKASFSIICMFISAVLSFALIKHSLSVNGISKREKKILSTAVKGKKINTVVEVQAGGL